MPIRADQLDITNGTISTVNAGDSSSEGTGDGVSRRDHQHAVATGGTLSTIEPDDSAAEGSSSNLAREDHTHAVVTAAPGQGIGGSNAEGSATSFARSDHDHTIRETGTQDLTVGAIADAELVVRSGTTLAGAATITEAQHGNLAINDGLQHAAATASLNGYMAAADKAKLDAITDPRFRDFKESVQIKSTGDVATLSGEQTIDGVLTSSSRIALFDQTTTTEDGIYVTDSGAWTRASDFQAGDGVAGAFFAVREGTANADKTFLVTNDTGSDVVGTDDLAVTQIGSGSPRSAGEGLVLNGNALDVVANADGSIVVNTNDVQVGVITEAQHGNLALNDGLQHAAATTNFSGFMTSAQFDKLAAIAAGATANIPRQERVTAETVTGSDVALTDTLDNTPISNASVALFFNGVAAIQGAGEDYTISGSTITWLASSGTAPNMKTTDDLVAFYSSAT